MAYQARHAAKATMPKNVPSQNRTLKIRSSSRSTTLSPPNDLPEYPSLARVDQARKKTEATPNQLIIGRPAKWETSSPTTVAVSNSKNDRKKFRLRVLSRSLTVRMYSCRNLASACCEAA